MSNQTNSNLVKLICYLSVYQFWTVFVPFAYVLVIFNNIKIIKFDIK